MGIDMNLKVSRLKAVKAIAARSWLARRHQVAGSRDEA